MRLIYGQDDERSGYWTAFFVFCTNRTQSLYLVTVFPSSVHQFFSTHFTSILQMFHVFLTIALYIYLCFEEKVVFRFLAFGFISRTIRISNKTSFLCKRLVLKNINLERIFPALQNWNVLHWTFKARGFNLQIILDSGKDLLLKTWLAALTQTIVILINILTQHVLPLKDVVLNKFPLF